MTVAHRSANQSVQGWDAPPALLIGEDSLALRSVEQLIDEAGLRIAATVPVARAVERLDIQAHAKLVWAELTGQPVEDSAVLLDRLQADATAGRYAVVISAPNSWLEIVHARAGSSAIETVIEGNDAQRAAALAVAGSRANLATGLSDVAADNSAARLRQLSDEVSRIAATLARLSGGQGPAPSTAPPAPNSDAPALAAETVRSVIRARRLRANYFAADLFADPAWDMLLDLLQAEIVQHRVPVSSLCIAASVPATTALRWIKSMTDSGLLARRDDPHDGRRVFIEMAPPTSAALRNYFAEVGRVPVI